MIWLRTAGKAIGGIFQGRVLMFVAGIAVTAIGGIVWHINSLNSEISALGAELKQSNKLASDLKSVNAWNDLVIEDINQVNIKNLERLRISRLNNEQAKKDLVASKAVIYRNARESDARLDAALNSNRELANQIIPGSVWDEVL